MEQNFWKSSPITFRPVCCPQTKITLAEAKNHFDQEKTVCGNVLSMRYASSTRGQPTFLNLDKPYPMDFQLNLSNDRRQL